MKISKLRGRHPSYLPHYQPQHSVYKQPGATRHQRICCLLVAGCNMCQQHASVSQGWFGSDSCTCCHTETEAADPTFYLTLSQYTDTRPTSPSSDPITPGAWQGSRWSIFSHWYDSTRKRELETPSGHMKTSWLQWKDANWSGTGTSHDHLDWPRLSYREQFKEEDEEADSGNDGKTTSKSGLALNGIPCYGKPRTARSGGSWL